MIIHILSGFLGSGKTTAIYHACSQLSARGMKAGIITNDQGARLVDGGYLNSLGLPAREVKNGCFCCNYDDLERHIRTLTGSEGTEIIFAESVGSCTDIVATVVKPLLRFFPGAPVTLSTFADVRLLRMILRNEHSFDEDVIYIYRKQLEESPILIINKIDLVDPGELEDIRNELVGAYPGKVLYFQNSLDQSKIMNWLSLLEEYSARMEPGSLLIDYDRYGAGEAKMAWLDEGLEIASPHGQAGEGCLLVIDEIYAAIKDNRYPIGHLKFLLEGNQKISFTSAMETRDPLPVKSSGYASLLINLRVQTDPLLLETLVAAAIDRVREKTNCTILVNDAIAFQPGYPRPTYRW